VNKPTCQACGAESPDAFLCDGCTNQLEQIIAELPAAIRDLEVAATRQARIGSTPRPGSAPTEARISDAEQRQIPARLRSKEGRITLPTTQLPFSPDAARLYRLAVNEVQTWARHLVEARGLELILGVRTFREGPICWRCDHDSCTSIRDTLIDNNQAQLMRLCTWLVAHIGSIRLDEAAGEIHFRFRALTEAIETMIDRPDPDVFVGKCTLTDVRVTTLAIVGAPCSGLTCDHDTCERIRSGRGVLSPQPGVCGAMLLARHGETKVECPQCGTTYDVAERNQWMVSRIADHLGTVRQVADALRNRGIDVTVDKIDGWVRHGRLATHGFDPKGHKLVKVSEVLEVAKYFAERAAGRARKMSA
jgi:hypothetical protein